jgi:hypothetical protein
MNGDTTDGRSGGPPGRTQLVERISTLLGEIEALSRGACDVPSPLLVQTHAILEKARSVLRTWAPEDEAGDPQPDVDRDLLDRMYDTLRTARLSR